MKRDILAKAREIEQKINEIDEDHHEFRSENVCKIMFDNEDKYTFAETKIKT
jgi:hypothetical protein